MTKFRLLILAAVVVVFAAIIPAAFGADKVYTIDGVCTVVHSEAAQAYLDAQIETQGGTAILYVYEGPDATDINGFTAFPDTDGDLAPGAPKEALEDAIIGEDDLVDSVFYPPGELNYRVDVYTVVAGCSPGAGLPDIDHSALCYTKFSDDVIFFDNGSLALWLVKGYWVPSVSKTGGGAAVQTGSAYHWVCNPASSLKPTGTKLGEDGVTVVPDSFAGANLWWWEILS